MLRLGFLLFLLGSPAFAVDSCGDSYAQVDGQREPISEGLAFIWFPKTQFVFTTTNLEVHEVVWNTQLSFYEKGSTKAVVRALRKKGTGLFRFGVEASAEEIEKVRELLHDREEHGMSCVKGACEVLKQAGIMRIPFPFDRVPVLQAVYLGFLRAVPFTRITRVEYVGVKPIQSLMTSRDLWGGEVFPMAGVGGMAVAFYYLIKISYFDDEGKEKELFVPLKQKADRR